MLKDFKTTIITGGIGTGKTHFIKKYINEVIDEENVLLYLVDPKMVELFEYKNRNNVIYLNTCDEFTKIVYSQVVNQNINKKVYIFIDEASEMVINETCKKQIKFLLKNKAKFNCELVLSSQLKTSFCQGMRKNAKTIINLN